MMQNIFDLVSFSDTLLIEYNSFFKEINSKCFFSIDKEEDVREIIKILSDIKEIDKNAGIFLYAYGLDEVKKTFYSDTILLDTVLSIDEIKRLFGEYDNSNNILKSIAPSEIMMFEREYYPEEINYVILNNCSIQKIDDYMDASKLDQFKCVYWD